MKSSMLMFTRKKKIKIKIIKTNDRKVSNENGESPPKQRDKQELMNHKNVTAIFGECMVKDLSWWDLLEQSKKVVLKNFSGSAEEDMKTYIEARS